MKKIIKENWLKSLYALVIFVFIILFSNQVEASTLGCYQVNGMSVFGYNYSEWKFIGAISNQYDSNSIANEYGAGSEYRSDSIMNEYGHYGGEYSSSSAFNDYTSTPPIIVDNNYKFIGYLTTNEYKTPNINTYEAITCAKNSYSSSNDDMKDVTFKEIPSRLYNSASSSSTPTVICPSNSSLGANNKCYCNGGYAEKDGKCITPDKDCQNTYGINSKSTNEIFDSEGSTSCGCKDGFEWNSSQTSCILIPVKTNDEICQNDFGLNSYWVGTKNKNGELDCNCKTGFIWKDTTADITTCVADETQSLITTTSVQPKKEVQKSIATKKMNEKNIAVTGQVKESNNIITPEPVKKVSWFRKIFNWFMGK